jgi:hypothetical protein
MRPCGGSMHREAWHTQQPVIREPEKIRKKLQQQKSHPRRDGFSLHGQSLASLKFALHPRGEIGPIASRPGLNLVRLALVGRNLYRMTLSCREGLCVAGDIHGCNRRAVPFVLEYQSLSIAKAVPFIPIPVEREDGDSINP